ncbi:MAG: isoleucine--tRNA ligase, partial [Oscillospiraceae bacterium]|nr:isoleucine--tRNA ligase [Candidatus Equicaccousia limihippi]
NKVFFVIWTTTTWTLPGNVAICLGPDFDYDIIKTGDEYLVIAKELAPAALAEAKIENYEVVATVTGKELEYITVDHPFLDRKSVVIVGDHVTLESGTGCVHTAPGHGLEDFEVCRLYDDIPIVVPVDNKGYLTAEAGEFSGLHIDDAGKPIAEKLESTGNLFAIQKITHQYPHCWRCKKPVIFRATEQWFCSISDFADKAVEAVKSVNWIPAWGEDRISSMIKDRSDWCISRQRTWGVPIPIFYCKHCGKEIISPESIKHIADLFRKEGPNIWYEWDASKLVLDGTVCPECGCTEFKKETGIMDVWFDSGSSHTAVLDQREEVHSPADLYLEGADQYRGWFQSSLLTSVATKGVAPYKTVVTHGWVVDGEGKKMSKSLGNTIIPDDIVSKFGADILRLWVASSDYHADIRVSNEILKQLSEVYRKIRNTARFILGNISDFNPNTDCVPFEKLEDIDKYALTLADNLVKTCREAYDNFEYHIVFHAIHNFCVVDMSNFYLDVLKDRLYVENKDSATRRAAQTAIYEILDTLTRLVAPILAFTSEEIWKFMPHKDADDKTSVLFNAMPEFKGIADKNIDEYFEKIHLVRDDVKKALEIARKDKIIGSSLDAKVTIYATGDMYDFLNGAKDLKSVFIVSAIEIVNGGEGEFKGEQDISVTVSAAPGKKCARCWSFSESVGSSAEHPDLCERCAKILGE